MFLVSAMLLKFVCFSNFDILKFKK